MSLILLIRVLLYPFSLTKLIFHVLSWIFAREGLDYVPFRLVYPILSPCKVSFVFRVMAKGSGMSITEAAKEELGIVATFRQKMTTNKKRKDGAAPNQHQEKHHRHHVEPAVVASRQCTKQQQRNLHHCRSVPDPLAATVTPVPLRHPSFPPSGKEVLLHAMIFVSRGIIDVLWLVVAQISYVCNPR